MPQKVQDRLSLCKKSFGNVLTLIITLVVVGIYLDWRVNVLPNHALHMVVPTSTLGPYVRNKTKKVAEVRRMELRATAFRPEVFVTKSLQEDNAMERQNIRPLTYGKYLSHKGFKTAYKNLTLIHERASRKNASMYRKKRRQYRNRGRYLPSDFEAPYASNNFNNTSVRRYRKVTKKLILTSQGEYISFNFTKNGVSSITRVKKQELDIMNMVSCVLYYMSSSLNIVLKHI